MKIIKIFIASPGDVAKERDIITNVIKDLDRSVFGRNNVQIKVLKWEQDASPSMGRPQQIILDQISGYDIFIGVMWKRFGSPTGKSLSGTKEEFENAYYSWHQFGHPRIMFYFSQIPYVIKSVDEADQLKLVLEFRRDIQKSGLVWEYTDLIEFEKSIRRHLTDAIYELIEEGSRPSEILLLGFDIKASNEIEGQTINKYDVFKKIIGYLSQNTGISTDGLIEKFNNRESLGSTAIGDGFALPHIYNTQFDKYIVAVIGSCVDINWEAMDGRTTKLIFLSLFPHRQCEKTLRILIGLSKAARTAVDKNKIKVLHNIKKIIEDTVSLIKLGESETLKYKILPNLVFTAEDISNCN